LVDGPGGFTWPDNPTQGCGGGNWGSPSLAGVQFVYCDGSVRTLNYGRSDPGVPSFGTIMWQLMRPKDGTTIVVGEY
jgi:hypothetical protein